MIWCYEKQIPLSTTQSWFLSTLRKKPLKTLCEMEKMLVTKSNFSFWFTFILSSANAFNLNQSKNLSFSKELYEMHVLIQCRNYALWKGGLTHYQMTKFWLFQTKRVCRRKFQIWQNWKKVIQTGRKQCGKKKLLVNFVCNCRFTSNKSNLYHNSNLCRPWTMYDCVGCTCKSLSDQF